MALTEAGEQLLRRVSPAIRDLEDAVNEATSAQHRPSGSIRINCSENGAKEVIQQVLPTSMRAPVVMRDGQRIDIDIFETAHVDGRHRAAVGRGAFAVRVHAANGAEAMTDHVLVEGVRAGVLLGCREMEVLEGNEPHQRAFALAYRTVARHDAGWLAFDLESDASAMTASLVRHGDLLMWIE
jgi:DNA-binding transcriptional LysR family regulator